MDIVIAHYVGMAIGYAAAATVAYMLYRLAVVGTRACARLVDRFMLPPR